MSETLLRKHPGLVLGPAHAEADVQAETLVFGFWVFLMSDAIIFGVLFATYASMRMATAGGPGPRQLYDIHSVFGETIALLSSSFTIGMAMLSLKHEESRFRLVVWLGVTLFLAAIFLALEVHDFLSMFAKGGGPTRSGFLSSFFSLVPLHGLHVTAGCVWMLALIVQMMIYGLDAEVKLGLLRLTLFWHFLDIVWIAIFSLVYLGGLA
jgi:cytochrome o ubiquinol oxidase subunit 3